jgi:hypothetical protein
MPKKHRKKPGPKPRPRIPLMREAHPWAPRHGLDRCINPRCTTPSSPHHTHGYCATCHHKRLRIVRTRQIGPEGLRRKWRLLKRAYRARLKEQKQQVEFQPASLPGTGVAPPPPEVAAGCDKL